MYALFLKRILDLTISTILVVVLSPIILLTTLLLWLENIGSTFFFQDRPGQYERRIRIVKFKSMTDEKDEEGKLLPDNQRITRLGRFVRKWSLDELPQLFNVIKGDMSLIGPRPLLFKYLPLYTEEQRKRHNVKPGITGWAQVNGRNTISWTRKFELDVYYVENLSFGLDFKIFWKTILKILKREGINQSQERPMQPFDGTN
jgi:lipopolysaccharide/colanic/teichoic acid biosynthesis glycosyltransferase